MDENAQVVDLLRKPPGDKKGGISEFVNTMKQIQAAHDRDNKVAEPVPRESDSMSADSIGPDTH